MPSSEETRLELVLEDTRENKAAINYFKTEKFMEGLKVDIAGILQRNVDISFRVVPPGSGDNVPMFWDVSKMNTEGVTFEVKKDN